MTRFQKMRSIMTNRKLRDIASTQTEEMAVLATELDTLQRRCFPSFARAPRRPLLNSDVRLPMSR